MRIFLLLIVGLFIQCAFADTYSEAKVLAKTVYRDHRRTFYCDCRFDKHARKVDLKSCGYVIQKNAKRAQRLEWEHVVPVSAWGQPLECWKQKCCVSNRCYRGRHCCRLQDKRFSQMEADLHNLVPVIGEVNQIRSNYAFQELPNISEKTFGCCWFKVDHRLRLVEPREACKGAVARTYLYMERTYGLKLTHREKRLFAKWHKHYPVSQWEIEKNKRVTQLQGRRNPFIEEKNNG